MDFKNGQGRDIGHKNCSSQTSSTNTKLVQYGQKLFHGNGHKLILESHDESTRNAFIYIGLILIIYIMAVIAIGIRYLFVRSNRNSSPFTPPNQSSNTRRNTVSLFVFLKIFVIEEQMAYSMPYN
jgi:hypothetical protein